MKRLLKIWLLIIGLGCITISWADDDTDDDLTPSLAVDDNGNVGIGTMSPEAKLHISGGNLLMDNYQHVTFKRTTAESQQVVSMDSNDDIVINRGSLVAGLNSNVIIGVGSGDNLDINNSSNTSIMRVKEATGNVGIGTTSPSATLEIVAGGTTLADAWTLRSSARFKENIQPIAYPLEKIQRLRGVFFDWKSDGKHDIGLIAEEVGEVIPELVVYEENGKDAKSLDYMRLVAILIEGMKEQQKIIDGQEESLDQVNFELGKLQKLESRMDQFEDILKNSVGTNGI